MKNIIYNMELIYNTFYISILNTLNMENTMAAYFLLLNKKLT